MPNRASHADHIAERSCVICRKRFPQPELMRFVLLEGRIVFDKDRKLFGRGYYLCDKKECFGKLEKWKEKQRRKRKK